MVTRSYPLNNRVQGLSCLRCGQSYGLDSELVDLGTGCGSCLEQGYPASLRVDYADDETWSIQQAANGMRRYAAQLPYVDFPSLGEGMTPLVELALPAQALRIEKLWVKNEGQNPTGSHKDRISALVVARAASLGRTTVVAASSGNAGASLAAYAGAARLHCAIISTPKISRMWAQAIELTGADLVLTDTPMQRWQYMRQMVEEEDWYPVTNYLNPPVGSNPFGVQGYKTVGFELVEQCGEAPPTMVVVPTARGDLLWGIWQGLIESEQARLLSELPRLVAVEPVPRLGRVLSGEDYRQLFEGKAHEMTSIGGLTATYQSAVALRESKGCAVEVSTEKAKEAQRELAHCGFYVELSSAASLAGLQVLAKQGRIDSSERVVLILTSHGYKEIPEG